MIATPAQALPTRWNLLVIPVDFSDEPGYAPVGAETTIVEGLNSFFYQQSNYTFDQIHVTWVPQVMRLAHPRRRYNFCNTDMLSAGETCLNMWNSESGLPTQLAKDAGYIDQIGAGLVPAGGAAADVFDQIMFIQAVSTTPDCTYNYPIMPGHSFAGKSVSADGSSRHRYAVGYVALGQHGDCVVDDHDFGPLAHGVGHGMADIYPHPACYQSAFNMMDSGYGAGYPSAIGVFDRMDESFLRRGDNRWFNGWLPASSVTSLSPPESSTEVLSPLEWDAADAVSPQGLKVDTGRGYYYLVECRRLQFPDDRIASEGTLIVRSPLCAVPVLSTPGCEYPSVESCVCAVDSYCCNTNWDPICVGEVSSLGCGTCRNACTRGSDPGAFEQSTETCVCSADSYCCTTAWDSICVSEVSSFGCGICLAGFAGPTGGGAASMSTTSMGTRRARPPVSLSRAQPVSR